MLSQAAVFGQVVSASCCISNPTVIEPLGFIDDGSGEPLNLTHFGLQPLAHSPAVPTLLVLGSSMDAGKTTAAAALVHGLSLAGWRVHAGKLTGTGCAKDVHKMLDAGAQKTLDFTSCGYVSTASTTSDEIRMISLRIIEHLSQDAPDLLVLEIADGLIQSETNKLARLLAREKRANGVILAIHDVMSARHATEVLEQEFGLPLFGISGLATRSPLSTKELRQLTPYSVYDIAALSHPSVALAMQEFLARHKRTVGSHRLVAK